MSMCFSTDVWAYTEDDALLDRITNDELKRLIKLLTKPEDPEWLLRRRQEECGTVEYHKPGVCRISAWGNYGNALNGTFLSHYMPDVYFVSADNAECSDEIHFSISLNGKYKALSEYYSFNELDEMPFAKVKEIFDQSTDDKLFCIPVTEDSEIFLLDSECNL